jgi:hypothetical protein
MSSLKTGNNWITNNDIQSPRYKSSTVEKLNSARQSVRNRIDLVTKSIQAPDNLSINNPGKEFLKLYICLKLKFFHL